MRVSVVLCTYSLDTYGHFREAARSVLNQSYDDIELVVVVDGNDDLCQLIHQDFGDESNIQIHCNDRNRGLSYGRNKGSEIATGDIVAFLDDDAVPAEDWIKNLVETYQTHDAVAVGGKMTPAWVAGKPSFLPEEFYWLIGVTYKGFPEVETEVRNTFSSNLSVDKEVFQQLGGFRTDMGKQGDNNLQGGETELCERLYEETGERVHYTPDAKVAHKVFDYRTDPIWLAKRAFWQGYSKRAMEKTSPSSGGEERAFLNDLLTEFVPSRVSSLVNAPSVTAFAQLVMLFVLTSCVGFGYLYGSVKYR